MEKDNMPNQEGSQLDGYQFQEYTNSTSLTGQRQNAPLAGPIQSPSGYTPVQSQPASALYSPSFPYSPPGYGSPTTYYPALPAQAVPRQKKMLSFPLTRYASPGKQVSSMAIYSLLMLALAAGSVFSIVLLSANQEPNNVFAHSDGTANGLLILVFILFILLVVPVITLLSGALFGAVRALLITCIVVGGTAGLWFVYAFVQHIPISVSSSNTPAATILVLSPVTAALVGFIYDRRRYAAWWKSFLSLLAGSAFFVGTLLLFTAIFGSPPSASQASLVGFYVTLGCSWALLAPLIALPVAGIEGIMHAITARREKTGRNQ
jgi:hypothetical protein